MTEKEPTFRGDLLFLRMWIENPDPDQRQAALEVVDHLHDRLDALYLDISGWLVVEMDYPLAEGAA